MDVLVLLPDAFDRGSFSAVPGHRFRFVETEREIDHWRPTGFDPLAYLERARAAAREGPVDAVVSTHDLGDYLAALLVRELGLPGPAPEAVFLGLHKYYGRRAERQAGFASLRCEALDLEEACPQAFGYPCFLKAPFLKLGLLGFRLDGPEDLARAWSVARRELPAWSRQYLPLFSATVDLAHYPLAGREVMLLEEFRDGPQVTVEGWVQNGRFHLWAITDTNTFPGSRAIDNFSLPSRLPAAAQERLAEAAERAVQAIGFDGGFVNVELWWQEGEAIPIEVNTRAAASFSSLYERCLGASHWAAIVEAAGGNEPATLPTPNGTVGGQFNLVTFAEGRFGDLLDLDAAREVPGISLDRSPDDIVHPVSEFGVVLAQVELFGGSYDEIHAEATRIRRRLLKRPWDSPG
ncbi:MAG TPA: ATP-grasp domain-containing protein [Thermoanaerobaculia bacterium]|jgi:biotin carboxylase|nr:ATP-grasp domain-containing protein [Thermoanaerobaculia bacterium]